MLNDTDLHVKKEPARFIFVLNFLKTSYGALIVIIILASACVAIQYKLKNADIPTNMYIDIINYILEIAKQIFTFLAATIIVSVILSYTNLKKQYIEHTDFVVSELRDEMNKGIKPMTDIINVLESTVNAHVETLPDDRIERLSEKLMDEKFKRAQQIEHVSEDYLKFVKGITKFSNEAINNIAAGVYDLSIYKKIKIEPIENDKCFRINLINNVVRNLPPVCSNKAHLTYSYNPGLETKMELDSYNFNCNKKYIKSNANTSETSPVYNVPLIENAQNSIFITADYSSPFSHFFWNYTTTKPCSSLVVECEIVGESKELWSIIVTCFHVHGHSLSRNKENIEIYPPSGKSGKENFVRINSKSNAWLLDGTGVNIVVYRKDN